MAMSHDDVEYERTPAGIVVRINGGSKLPGFFTNELMAKKAADRYLNKAAEHRARKVKD